MANEPLKFPFNRYRIQINMEKDITLKLFITENQSLLSAIAILATLATLLNNLPINWISYSLSFLLLSAMALLWSEIKLKRDGNDGLSLYFFKLFMQISYWLIILYILLSHRILSWFTLAFPIALALIFFSVKWLRKIPKILKLFKSNKKLHRALASLISIIVTVISFYVAGYLSIPANELLDQIDHLSAKINLY